MRDRSPLTKPLSVEDCFDQFTYPEALVGPSMAYCTKCKSHHNSTKVLSIWSSPRFLIIHLKRLVPAGKIRMFVDFPLYGLDMSRFTCQAEKRIPKTSSKDSKDFKACSNPGCLYDLYAVVNHIGNSFGGHYIAFVKTYHNGKWRWHCYDDDRVYEIEEKRVKTSTAYMLFYYKRGCFNYSLDFISAQVKKALRDPVSAEIEELLRAIDEQQMQDENQWCGVM
eukprot:CAMPEP_0170198070 /NCGR_PEP_ID=MMETSP0040_2-20121228/67918_1 /TAXON_ID=641309 /ORGANISM="Lotharella oceanica, Strain CCMP622" /LENGTH=222 /DNA_ID=CAMNT_0010447917 /DNA_START=21 /DNA_END=689 /DNA_ORIENTATION=-